MSRQICSPGHDPDIWRTSLKYISSWFDGCRSGLPLGAPTQIGLSVRKPARQRVCTHVRAMPRDFSPCGINQVKKTCRKVLTLGSAHPACCVPSRIPERVKLYPRCPYRASLKRRVLPRDLLVWIYSTDERDPAR